MIRRDATLADDDPRVAEIWPVALSGAVLRAEAMLSRIGPPERLGGARVRCLVAWLREQFGDRLRARREFLRVAKEYPDHPEARHFRALVELEERGPVHALRLVDAHGEPRTGTEPDRAEFHLLRARLCAYVLDHGAAERHLASCPAELVSEARWASARAGLLQQRNDRNKALSTLEEALAKDAGHRTLVQHTASLLAALDRPREALSLLERAETVLETPFVVSQRAAVEHELGMFVEEASSLERFERRLKYVDAGIARSIVLRRTENTYRRGDVAGALRSSAATSDPYWATLRSKLAGHAGPPIRKVLDVGVLVQEPMGCAPTCLALLSAYFGSRVDQVDVAEQICYEGTASHSEREWVESRGWISREFTVDFDIARTLVERGLPFLLVTVAIASAHAQVVMGVDATRRTLVIRDPSTFGQVEADADALFESHRAFGPRGHLILPAEKAHLLQGIELPEAHLHDLSHRTRVALEGHQRLEAARLCEELAEVAPRNPLLLWARRSIAGYDEDPYAIKACSEAIIAEFPNDVNAELSLISCLSSVGTHDEQRARIQARLEAEKPVWIFRERLAQLLITEPEQFERARRLAARAHRTVPMRGQTLSVVAEVDRARGEFAAAVWARRIASTLEPTDDRLAWAYFQEAFHEGRVDEALEVLAYRTEYFRSRSTGPAAVLFQALEWLDRVDDAFRVLDAAIEARPDDSGGLLYAAEAHARYGRFDLAELLLSRAARRARSATIEGVAARLAELRSNLAEALRRHEAVLTSQPLCLPSHRAIAYLTSELQGLAQARAHLSRACARHPSHSGLRELYVIWLRGHDPSDVLPEIDTLLSLQPRNGWARRERALVLSQLGEHGAAIEEARQAALQSPNDPSAPRVLSSVLHAAGRRGDAIEPARRALELAPDAPGAVPNLLRLSRSFEERLALLDAVEAIVGERSTTDGTGLLDWADYATRLRSGGVVLARAEALVRQRPEIWATHLILGEQHLREANVGRACEVLKAATERFPYVPRLYLALADVARVAQDAPLELSAVERAAQLAPGWTPAILAASAVLERRGDGPAGLRQLERGLAHHPRSAELTRAMAEVAWKAGEADLAIERIRRAIEFAPEAEASWVQYLRYATTVDRVAEVVEYGRQVTAERPWNPFVWLRLAEVLRQGSENLASLEALSEALERRPRLAEALDVYVITLARLGRKEEALAACDRPVESYQDAGGMLARKAWVRWAFGERERACKEMRDVLGGHPDHGWALECLVEWALELKQNDRATSDARSLVRIDPLRTTSHAYLAAALHATGAHDDAVAALATAARIDPSYVFAGDRRVTIALERDRVADAESVLETQGPHVPADTRLLWEVRIATHEKDDARALVAFERLALSDTALPRAREAAASVLLRRSSRGIHHGLRDLARRPGVAADVGSTWVECGAERDEKPSAAAIWWLGRFNPETQRTAAVAYYADAGARGWSAGRIAASLVFLGRLARRYDEVWGKVGYALTARRAYLLSQLWLAGYSRRSNIESWMLHNYRVAALNNHQPRAALAAVERALALPADDLLHRHLAFVAFGRAVSGNVLGARAIVAGWAPQGLGPHDQWLFNAAEKLVALAESTGGERRKVLAELAELAGRGASSCLWPFGAGYHQRDLAAGVLRFALSPHFIVRRWGLHTLFSATVALLLSVEPHNPEWWLVTALIVGCFYLLARLST